MRLDFSKREYEVEEEEYVLDLFDTEYLPALPDNQLEDEEEGLEDIDFE